MFDALKNVYAKDYGYGDDYRMQCVLDSLLHGVEVAAKKRRVSTTSIYKWRKDYARATLELLG